MPVIAVMSRRRGRALRGDSGAWEQCCGQLLGECRPRQPSSRVSPACGKSDVVYSVINDRLPDGVAAIVLKERSVTGIEPPAFPVTATTAAQVVVLVIR